jgi:hypothetical protein
MSAENPTLIDEINNKLDESCEQIEPQVRSRLTQMRYLALDSMAEKAEKRQAYWLPLGALATASLLVIIIFLDNTITASKDHEVTYVALVDDMEILYSGDSLDLYEEVEFYQWLADNESSI